MAKYEIAQCAMKSEFHSDEICYADEIKSTLPLLAVDFIPARDFIIEDDFTHPNGWISLKRKHPLSDDKGCFLFW